MSLSLATAGAGRSDAPDALLDTVALYLHIPFCHRKCHYCDFNTYAGMLNQRAPYVAALRDEILWAGERTRLPGGERRRCRTIFFGGGTPSLLTPAQVAELITAAREAFDVDAGAEVSLEANPAAMECGPLDEMRSAGVNRLSMGAQSFDAGLLRWLSRIHTPEDVVRALANARAAGFENVNLDFMYALPGQSLEVWAETLERAVALAPEHLSLYSLIVEEGTPLYDWVARGEVVPADEDVAADMYELAEERLARAGYEHYEISNWARAGRECAHNVTYWHNLPYIGLGAGAHGWYGGRRYVEAKPIGEYVGRVRTAVRRGEVEALGVPAAAVVEDERIGRELEMAETAIMGLRLAAGIDTAGFARRYGRAFEDVFGARLREARDAGLVEEREGSVRLTERGKLLGNEVFERLLPDREGE